MAENINAERAALLPCPFCGGAARIRDGSGWYGAGCDTLTAGVMCFGYCHARQDSSRAEAAARWNRRTPSASIGEDGLPAPGAFAVESNVGNGMRVITKFSVDKADADSYANREDMARIGCDRKIIKLYTEQQVRDAIAPDRRARVQNASINVQNAGAGSNKKPAETRMDAGSAASAKAVGARPADPLITVSFNDLMTLAKRLIAEQLDDCDEELMAARAHGIGSLHSEILGLAKRTAGMAQEQGEVEGDAARYRWLKERFIGYDFYWGGDSTAEHEKDRGKSVIVFECGEEFEPCRDFGKEIDRIRGTAQDVPKSAGTRETCRISKKVQVMQECDASPAMESPASGATLAQMSVQSEESDARQTRESVGSARLVIPATLAEDVLSTVLWLYRRLPRGYGRPPTVERPILALAKQVSIDVADCLAERGPEQQSDRKDEA